MYKNHVCFFQKGSIEIINGEGKHKFPYHTHDSFMLGVVKSGVVRFNIGNNVYILKRGMTYIVPPKVGISITSSDTYSYLTICIKSKKKAQICNHKLDSYILNYVGDQIILLCNEFQSDKISENDFINKLTSVLDFRINNDKQDFDKMSTVVKDAAEYIIEHVDEKFVLDDLAEAIHISKYYLVRIFKEEMGVSPKQYDQQCKIRKAKEYILGDKSETDIAYGLAYSSQSHLCDMFKRYMGISIIDYRKSTEKK